MQARLQEKCGGFALKKKLVHVLLYIALIAFSASFILVCNRITSSGALMFQSQIGNFEAIYIVRVDAVLSVSEEEQMIGDVINVSETQVRFSSTVLFGGHKGESLMVTQYYDNVTSRSQIAVKEGDWIFAYQTEGSSDLYTGEFFRLHFILILFAIFVLLLVIFAKFKGLSSIIALMFSVLGVFLVFIPAILSGRNIYLWAMLICLYTVTINPFFIGGVNAKSLSSAIGCTGGLAVAALLTLLLNSLLNITGSLDEDNMLLQFILEDHIIDLRAVTFAAILIGALGAAIDVSMSIATAISEFNDSEERATPFSALLRYGMNIGRDIIGAQTSTLVLAYIGSSLTVTLLLVAYQNSVLEMMNLEMIIVEILQMLIGGFVILFTIPATAFICGMLFSRREGRTQRRRVPAPQEEDIDAFGQMQARREQAQRRSERQRGSAGNFYRD